MKVKKSSGKLVLTAGFVENFINQNNMIAKQLEFDYVRQVLFITRGKIKVKKNDVPFSSIKKVYHRMYGQEDNLLSASSEKNPNGGQSSLSIVFLDMQDRPNETIYIQSYERGGKASREARKIISKIQTMVDEIAHFIWKPVVIECKEIGFFVDMEKHLMLLKGTAIPLSKVWLVQAVETEKGYYAVEVYTSGGDVFVTAEGKDKTLYISDTVRMVAEKANLPFQRVPNKRDDYAFSKFPFMEKKKVEDNRTKAKRVIQRLVLDDGGDNGETLGKKGS